MAARENTFETEPLNRRAAFISWRWFVIGSLVIIVLGVGGVLIAYKSRGSPVERGTSALVDAFSSRRLIEPRLSGAFKGGEFNPSRHDTSDIKWERLQRAHELLEDAAATGDARAQLGYAKLLLSKGEKLPEALKYLRRAMASAPESAEAHNDLGVCFIQQEKFEDAIHEFDAALKHKSDMPEALFNRALSYQRLLLRDPARNDFNRAAEVERDKGWLDEIKRRIEELSRPPEPQNAATSLVVEFDAAFAAGRIDDATRLVDRNSELLRTHAIWDATIEHLQRAVDGDPVGAERALSEIRLIGNVLIEKLSDSITGDVGKYLASLPDSARRTELGLIKGYVETSRRDKMTDETNLIFERLEKEFRARGNDVFEALSAFKVADYYYYSKRFKESIEKLKQLLSSVESREWPFDRARFLNALALVTSRLGQDSLAIKYFQQAISLCSESPELESRILQYMSVPYIQLGNIDGALGRLRESTKSILENGRPSGRLLNLAYNYSQIASIYSLRNQHALALLYAYQALSYSEQAKKSEYAAEFSSFVAVENARLSQSEQAEANLKRAFDYLEATAQSRARDLTEARVLTNAIEIASRSGDTQRALGYYARAEGLAALDEGNALLTIDLLRARANAYIASGQNDRARSDLVRAVSEIERYRANIATGDQRSHFLDASHSVFDQLISLDVGSLDRSAEAFEMSERSRARALLEEISHTARPNEPQIVGYDQQNSARTSGPSKLVAPLTLADVRSKLPDDLTVVQYSVTSKGTYLFLITRSGLKVKESSATTETLDRLTREYIAGLRNIAPIDEINEKARELYDYLIKPVEREIDGVMNLCIVPDKALHFLPFAGLVDGSLQYLFKSHRLSYAPSASVLIRCLKEGERTSAAKLEKILAVGDPKFNSEYFPNLRPLEDAEREAGQSARFYAPESVTLIGAQATEPRVRSAMGECDVAHLAVHCLVDESSPWLAALVLAGTTPNQSAPLPGHDSAPAASPPAGATSKGTITRSAALTKALPQEPAVDPNDGLLYLSELYGMKLPRTRLVVLSACQSGLGQYYRGEGIVSLVRPLLAAGVPTVVASLWPVDSKATSELMIEFHKQRKLTVGMHAAEALRRAQVELARTYEHPFYWAPFIVVGGSSASR
ncbi:MAG: CHAT domain-containing protein [Acidobacteriota bacterium]